MSPRGRKPNNEFKAAEGAAEFLASQAGEQFTKGKTSKAKTSKVKTESTMLEVPALEIKTLNLRLVGDTTLILNKWSAKAMQAILNDHMGLAKEGKKDKVPFEDYYFSLYLLTGEVEKPTPEDLKNARFGFPGDGVKSSAVAGAYRGGYAKDMVSSYGAFHVIGEGPDNMVEIIPKPGTLPRMRFDIVRVVRTIDTRFRGEFEAGWSINLCVRYNPAAISPSQILNLFQLGGFAVGIGEWRVEKKGHHGMYHVELLKEGAPA